MSQSQGLGLQFSHEPLKGSLTTFRSLVVAHRDAGIERCLVILYLWLLAGRGPGTFGRFTDNPCAKYEFRATSEMEVNAEEVGCLRHVSV